MVEFIVDRSIKFDWAKHREEQEFQTKIREALWKMVQEHNAKVNAERKAEVPETVEKRKPGRPKGNRNKR